MYLKLILLLALFTLNLKLSFCDIFDDAVFQQKVVRCRMHCAQNDPDYNNKQTCKDFPSKQLVLTDCEIRCLELSADELEKAGTCTCVSGKCVGDKTSPSSSSSAVAKFVLLPELFALCLILYSVMLVA